MNVPAAEIYELKGRSLHELETFARSLGEPAYRGRQLARWIYQRGAASFEEMTDLPAALRRQLGERARITSLAPLTSVTADGGDTAKYLLALADGLTVETVYMRYADGRRSVCISTQVGCAMGCTFCATGLAGLSRNLTAGEIIDQVLHVQRATGERVTNVVFMGMGEPLANYEATLNAVRLLNAPYAVGIAMRQLTVSTVGLVPQIRRLAAERLQLTLAVSLHAPNDTLRSALVPVNRRWPVAELLEASAAYVATTGRRISFEYVLMEGINDTPALGAELGERLAAGSATWSELTPAAFHVNLIPWNPVYGLQYRRPGPRRVEAFAQEVRRRGVAVTVRLERGVDIDAACGQLRRTHAANTRTSQQANRPSSARSSA
ncbi:MAG TPA: 23S rRNA (adenine(2503)-C(2))-methyltransferase RlmN [bacterium]|jgi:23S rRNA (adenine2503-C2)-methyltransferase